MNFEQFCRAMGLNPAELSPEQRAKLESVWQNCDTRNAQIDKDIFCRVFRAGPNTFDKATGSVTADVFTDAPCWMFDWDRGFVQEVLPMSACRMPGQIPLCDTHNIYSVKAVLGSCRNPRIESRNKLEALAFTLLFARDKDSQDAMNKVEDGHVTDLSGGYRVFKSTFVEENNSFVFNGRTYSGPLKVVTDWEPYEGSLCPIGADQFSKTRAKLSGTPAQNEGNISTQSAASSQRNAGTNTQEANAMKKTFEQFCRAIGIDAATLADAQRSMLELIFEARCKDLDESAEIPADAKERAMKVLKSAKEVAESALRADQERRKGIEDVCILAGYPEDKARTLSNNPEMDQARAIEAVRNWQRENNKPLPQGRASDVSVGENRTLSHVRAAAPSGLAGNWDSRVKIEKPEDSASFRSGGTESVIRCLLIGHGVDTSRMSRAEVIDAMFCRSYVLDDFANITADAANIKLAADVAAAETVYQLICEIGNVADFKKNYRARLMDSGSLKEVKEGGEYETIKMSDEGSYIQIVERGGSIPLTRKILINDGIGAILMATGRVVTRTQLDIEASVFGHLINNKMFDGKDIFSVAHKNIGTAAHLGTSAMDNHRKLLAAIKGDNGQPMGLKTKFILTGANYARQAAELVTSPAAPDATNSGTNNYYKGLIALETSAITDTKWFTLGSNSIEPHLEVAFLNGQRNPTVTRKDKAGSSGIVLDVNMDYGTTCHSWRNIISNDGSNAA